MSMRYPQNSYYIDDQLLNVFQAQKQQLDKMKEQNKILNMLNQKVVKKDQQIDQLQKNIRKYKKYYEDYDLVKATLNQKNKQNQRLLQENKMLFTEMNKSMTENKQLQQKLLNAQKIKHEFIKQRNASDARFRGIQETFRQYQQQCKIKQRQLIKDLQKSYIQVKQLNNKIQDFHSVKFENQQLKAKITNLNSQQTFKSMPGSGEKVSSDYQQNMMANRNQNTSYNPMTFQSNQHQSNPQSNPKSINNYSKSRQKSPNKSYSQVYDHDSNAQIQRLRRQLISKQMELQRSKALNHELSIEFDKSVSKICEFEKQLSMYRKQNHQLKKTLSLFVQREQYEKMHKNKIRNLSGSQESQQQQDQQFGGQSRDDESNQ